MSQLDTSAAKRRQIYLFAFPAGVIFVTAFIVVNHGKLPLMSELVGGGAVVTLVLYSFILFFRPLTLYGVETSFYFYMSLFFPIFAGALLTNPGAISRMSPELFAETVNGMTVWDVIFFVGAFLSIPPKAFKVLMFLVFGVTLLVAAVNILMLFRANQWDAVYLFHWLHSFFALGVTILLISRIGRLQQIYATTDKLTGLLNRHAGSHRLSEEYERVLRYGTPFAVILIDIDHFKEINDRYGHVTGDRVLKEIAGLLSSFIRKTDSAVRWGGEEFLLLLPGTNLDNSFAMAQRLKSLLDGHAFFEVHHVTASFGVTTYMSGQALDDILQSVDKALYQAKQNGRNQVAVYR